MDRKGPVFKALLLVIATGLVSLVILPLIFFVSLSFFSGFEAYQFPQSLLPMTEYKFRVEYVNDKYKIDVFDRREGDYVPLLNTKRMPDIIRTMRRSYSIDRTQQQFAEMFEPSKAGPMELTVKKDMFYNFKAFFSITSSSKNALQNSVSAALWTILISLSIGSLSGYAIAKYRFKGREELNLGLLIVRMFPVIAISIPLSVDMIKLGLFDTTLGLALIYSIPNIALTAWITNSIFVGISTELEEAALVFGATRLRSFLTITLPLAFPGLAACSLYAFLAAWNDMITALIMTSETQTLALVIYKTTGGSDSALQLAAAGSIILIIPALVFTMIIRKYIGQMWGQVKVG